MLLLATVAVSKSVITILKQDAEERAYRLQGMLKEWDPKNSNSVGIVHTCKPYKVF